MSNGNNSKIDSSPSDVLPKVKIVDLNVAVEIDPTNPFISGGTGLREWSAPETRSSLYYDVTCDCWTLGCVMYLLCTG